MSQLKLKFIPNDLIDGTKIKLANAQTLRARNAANTADVALFSLTAANKLVFNTQPEFAADPTADDHLTRKVYVDNGLSAKQDVSEKGQANGYASLDGAGKVPVSQLPSAVMTYEGVYNASTNTPALSDGTGDPGMVYRVSVAGTQDFGSGNITFEVGDYAIYSSTGVWEKSDTTDAVASVNGQTGNVTLDTDDVNEGSTNQYFTEARAKTAVVDDAIVNGVTDKAPSQNAVFDALAGYGTQSIVSSATPHVMTLASPRQITITGTAVQTILLPPTPWDGLKVIVINQTNQVPVIQDSAGTQVSTMPQGHMAVLTFNGTAWTILVQFYRTTSGYNAGARTIFNMAEPTNAQDAATKNYVDTQITANPGYVPANEVLTLDSTDISNGYKDLAVEAIAASVQVTPVGGLLQEPGADFTLSVVGGKTRITFAGDLAALLEAGDKLICYYGV